MRTLRNLLLSVMVTLTVFFVSCTNDYDMWDEKNEVDTWEVELHNIVSDLDFLFDNSCVKFLNAERINDRIDSTIFINNETYYPICMKNLYNCFMLAKAGFIMKDTCTIHVPFYAIKGIVSGLVKEQNKYDFIRLTWAFKNDTFYTIAVFDKTNGQMVYDNILTNIPFSQMTLPDKKSRLTRSEGGDDNNVEKRIFYKDTQPYSVGMDEYIIKVKAICKLRYYYDNNNMRVEMRIYDDVKCKFILPEHPYYNYNSQAEVAKCEDFIVYYIWIGEGSCPFNSTPKNNCEAAWNAKTQGYTNIEGTGDAWRQQISTIIDIAQLEQLPTEGEWYF
ncbi:MAG: hypothetical protein J6W18_04195 [Bacteroidaceae bacterium]|nr:hypothetical protein [Bacteroidaceae bacterium]